jgi:hypothetical protein
MCTTADKLSLATSAIEEGGGTEKLSGKAMNLSVGDKGNEQAQGIGIGGATAGDVQK